MCRISLLLITFIILYSCESKERRSEAFSFQKATEEANHFKDISISSDFDHEIDALIDKMTLSEKVKLLHGETFFSTGSIERLGIPSLEMTDGPLGIREELKDDSFEPLGREDDYATYYPAGGGLSATWNRKMALKFGNSVGEEARARNKDMILSPAINIIRSPLGGRTYEYWTEDPFLNKELVVPFIQGVQKNNVGTVVKHFLANNQETNRDFVDVEIDERTLHEIYLPGFEAAVKKGQTYGIMASYNKFRGDYLSENKKILSNLLKEDWGFKGIVVSDWGGVHSTGASLKAGLDIEMGTPKDFNEYYFAEPLIDSVNLGKVSEKEVNKHVKRVLRLMYNLKMLGDDVDRDNGELATEKHFQDTYDIAAESIILLKNEKGVLPINVDSIHKVGVIGANATKKNSLGGYGAGVKTRREITPLKGLKNRLPESIEVNYAKGYLERYKDREEGNIGDITQAKKVAANGIESGLVKEAQKVAKESDVTFIFAGSNRDYETEASDRQNLELPFNQETLILKVLDVNPDAIVVITGGTPFDIQELNTRTSSLIWNWFNGSEEGNALADVLLGKINPSGRLPWTIPQDLKDSPAHATHSFPGNDTVFYKEGLLVGYRWFDTKNITPLYPFGYGLSYTNFEIEGVKADKKEAYTVADTIYVSVDVKNIGEVEGKEVVQLYVSKKDSKVKRGEKELKGFDKVKIKAGESKMVTIAVPVKELAYYNVSTKKWTVEKGGYTFKIGDSSKNIAQEITVSVQ